ncbi:MAG: hypothetical protein HY816_18130 [Candidatus Wallbacteria bacterium]|nr:hypothetical protein [Candidatus Wallbacteria bacterium]
MNAIWKNLLDSISAMTLTHRGAFYGIGLVAIGIIGWLLIGASHSGHRTIAKELPDASAATALAARLQTAGIAARVTSDEHGVEVPEQQFAAAARVASERDAMPKRHTGMFMEIVKKNSMLLSTEERRMVSLRALEARVEDNLETYEPVQNAAVNLSMPHDTGFAAERGAVKASIILTLKPQAKPEPGLLRTIRNAVSHTVDGLQPENISISDSRGTDLTRLIEAADHAGSGATDSELAAHRTYERELARKVVAQLSPLFGEENVSVNVTVPLQASAERPAPRRRLLANRPAALTAQLASYGSLSEPIASLTSLTASTSDPQKPAAGRLSVSVLVNSLAFPGGNFPEGLRRTAEQLARAAVGANQAANDVFTVVAAPFRQPLPAPAPGFLSLATVGDALVPHTTAIWGGVTLVVGLALLAMLRFTFPRYKAEDLLADPAQARAFQEECTEYAVLLGLSASELSELLDGDCRRDLAIVLASARQPLRDFVLGRIEREQRELVSAQVGCAECVTHAELLGAKQRLFERLHARA